MRPYYFVSRAHYYGDIVRQLFFASAILMLIGLPFFNERLPVPTVASLAIIVSVGFLAGLMNPVKQMPAWATTLTAGAAVILFEYFAVEIFKDTGADLLFLADQALAVIFLIALYFGTKTLRAMIVDKPNE